jgi:long-chain acyl-CoA synthetase
MRLSEHPRDQVAIATRKGTWTYGDICDGVAARGRRLRALDDAVVSVAAAMTADFVMTLLALLEESRPTAVCAPGWTPDERQARHALLGAHLEIDSHAEVVRRWPGPPAPVHPLARLVLFTTGSTGQPKAVQLSGTNIHANTRAVIEALAFADADEQTLFLPLSYSFGLLGHLIPALELGIPTRLVERLTDLPDMFAAGSIRGMLSGVPSHWEAILRTLPPGFTCEQVSHVVTAGAYSPPDLRRRLHQAFPRATLFNNYGQTEASPRILCLRSSHPLFYSQATGYPVGDLEVRLADGGELLVSGSQVMLGYLGDEEGTRRKVIDGWLATGDQASIADDGLVTITGRLDELVNIGGERTSALEIEAAIRRVDGVGDVAVVFVRDELYGAACVAYVEPVAQGVTEDQVLADLRRLVSGHKIPKALHLVPSLPRNQHGKVDRPQLEAIHRRAATL